MQTVSSKIDYRLYLCYDLEMVDAKINIGIELPLSKACAICPFRRGVEKSPDGHIETINPDNFDWSKYNILLFAYCQLANLYQSHKTPQVAKKTNDQVPPTRCPKEEILRQARLTPIT